MSLETKFLSVFVYLRVIEDETGGRVDWDSAGVGGRVRDLSSVKLKGIKLGFPICVVTSAPIQDIRTALSVSLVKACFSHFRGVGDEIEGRVERDRMAG